MSSIPWLGMDDDADKDLELLMAFKRHKDVTRSNQLAHIQSLGWLTKMRNVVMGQTVSESQDEGISAGDALRESFAAMRQQNVVVCVLALSGLLMQLCEVEVLYSKNGETNAVIESMKIFVSITTLISVGFLWMWYRLYYDHLRLTNQILSGDTFFSSGMGTRFVLEVCILLIHAPPFVLARVPAYAFDEAMQTWKKVSYNSDELILTVMFLRFYLLIRAVMHTSGLQNEKAQAVSSLYQEDLSGLFMVKMFVSSQPLVFISAVTFSSIFTYTYWFLIFERVANDDLSSAPSCLWLVITTMTKTGYGDVFAVTMYGRLVTLVVCVTAQLLIVLSVMALFVFVQPTNRQLKVMQVIWKTQARAKMSNVSAATIQRLWRRWNGMVYDHRNPDRIVLDEEDTAIELRRFRQARKATEVELGDTMDTVRTELIDYRNDMADINEIFQSRIDAVQNILESSDRKIARYLTLISEQVEQMEAITKEIERRTRAAYL